MGDADTAVPVEDDAVRAGAIEENAVDHRMVEDTNVAALPRGPQVSDRGTAPPATAHRLLHRSEAFMLALVHVGG